MPPKTSQSPQLKLRSVPLLEQLAYVREDLRLRRGVYGSLLQDGKTKEAARVARQIDVLEGVQESLGYLYGLTIWAHDHHPDPRQAKGQADLFAEHEGAHDDELPLLS